MIFKSDKESFVAIESKEAKIYEDFIKACEIIKAEAAKWDGKVFNKRFINAMNPKLAAIGGDEQYTQFVTLSRDEYNGLELFNRDRCTVVGNHAHYAQNYVIRLASSKFIVDGRINADVLCNFISEYIGYMKKSIEQKQRAIQEFDKVVDKVEELRRMVNDAIKDFPTPFYTKFNLEIGR